VLGRPTPEPCHRSPVILGPARAASIIVVTYGNLALTRLCLESVLAHTQLPRFEIVVVDNDSDAETIAYLEQLAAAFPRITLLRNATNRGFGPAVNQGLAVATGRVLVVLNNDVIVTPDWLTGLMHHLDEAEIGLVGPVTNAAPNEARVPTDYRTYAEMLEHAATHRRWPDDAAVDLPVATMFCVAMRRGVYTEVGPLDESFTPGQFEDDDYSLRVRNAGYRVVCAQDVFIHHFGEGSFGELVPTGEHARVFSQNRRRFENKWSVLWHPHQRRPSLEYEQVKAAIHRFARERGMPWEQVLVVSNGDEELLGLDGVLAGHFPQDRDGGFAGHHPADSAAAVDQLDDLRARGAGFLVFPATATWWLDHYVGLREHLSKQATELDTGSASRVFAFDKLAIGSSTAGEEEIA
jgi:GT2 family glycosyltransferase